MNQASAILSGTKFSRDVVEAIPVPTHTRSWRPISYKQIIETILEEADRHNLTLLKDEYALAHNGNQLFATFSFDTHDSETSLAIGARQALDKSLASAFASGGRVFVCDNLCFSGDAYKVIRKNTTNVWADFQRLVAEGFGHALHSYADMQRDIAAMKAAPCELELGYAFLGVAVGRGLLTPTQATVAYGDWKTPRYEDFAERNVWGLYNAVTEALKRGGAGGRIDRQVANHTYFTKEILTISA